MGRDGSPGETSSNPLPKSLCRAPQPFSEQPVGNLDAIRAAFVYGSIAKGTDVVGSDIDLMVISDTVGYRELFEALQSAEGVLARRVNPNVMTHSDWVTKRADSDWFAARIAAAPRLFVLGADDDLA